MQGSRKKKGADQTHPALFMRGFQPEHLIGGTKVPHGLTAFLKGKKQLAFFGGEAVGSVFVFVVVAFFFFFFLKEAFLARSLVTIPCVLSTRPSKAFVALWQQHSVFFPGISHNTPHQRFSFQTPFLKVRFVLRNYPCFHPWAAAKHVLCVSDKKKQCRKNRSGFWKRTFLFHFYDEAT